MLFDRKIEPCCSYCRYGSEMARDMVACVKRGIMDGSGSCGMFRYEPTKRVPGELPRLKASGLTEDDFSLI